MSPGGRGERWAEPSLHSQHFWKQLSTLEDSFGPSQGIDFSLWQVWMPK